MSALKPHLPFRRRLNQVLFDIRNSPHRMLGTSPSEALFTHPLHTRVPMVVIPRIVNPGHELQAKAAMAADHDSRRGVQSLLRLNPGETVIIQDGYCDTFQPWTVVQQYGRQVGVTNGTRLLLHNRQHVREYQSPAAPAPREVVLDRRAKPIQSASCLVTPSKPVKPIPGSPSKPSEPVTPSLPSSPSPPVRPVIVPLDHTLPAESDSPAPERLFRDGLVT